MAGWQQRYLAGARTDAEHAEVLIAEIERLLVAASELAGIGEDMHSMLVCLLGAGHPQVERHYQKFEAALRMMRTDEATCQHDLPLPNPTVEVDPDGKGGACRSCRRTWSFRRADEPTGGQFARDAGK